jgi:hypothetical protein
MQQNNSTNVHFVSRLQQLLSEKGMSKSQLRMIAKHIENEQAFAEILDASVKKSREAYARREADQKAADIASYPKQEDW